MEVYSWEIIYKRGISMDFQLLSLITGGYFILESGVDLLLMGMMFENCEMYSNDLWLKFQYFTEDIWRL